MTSGKCVPFLFLNPPSAGRSFSLFCWTSSWWRMKKKTRNASTLSSRTHKWKKNRKLWLPIVFLCFLCRLAITFSFFHEVCSPWPIICRWALRRSAKGFLFKKENWERSSGHTLKEKENSCDRSFLCSSFWKRNRKRQPRDHLFFSCKCFLSLFSINCYWLREKTQEKIRSEVNAFPVLS